MTFNLDKMLSEVYNLTPEQLEEIYLRRSKEFTLRRQIEMFITSQKFLQPLIDDYKEINTDLFEAIKIIMTNFKPPTNELEKKLIQLRIRLELFNRVPSTTNMLLAYKNIEEITIALYKTSSLELDEKLIDRFDKLKNLALGTKYIEERKLAFNKSLDMFKKLTGVEI